MRNSRTDGSKTATGARLKKLVLVAFSLLMAACSTGMSQAEVDAAIEEAVAEATSTTTQAPTTTSTTTAESTTTTTVAVEATTTTSESTGESTPKRWVDENGVIEANGTYVLADNLSLNGIIEGDATVPSGTTLDLHGIITGDLTVLEGGVANIFGVLSGDLRAAGTVDISGIVDGSVQSEPSANVTIHPGSFINGVEQ